MALFEFGLVQVEEIEPWGTGDDQSLTWFALTDGALRMPVGAQTLFEYTDAVWNHWNVPPRPGAPERFERSAHYQVASFARDLLDGARAGLTSASTKASRTPGCGLGAIGEL